MGKRNQFKKDIKMRKLLSTVLTVSTFSFLGLSSQVFADIPVNTLPELNTHSENTNVQFSDRRADITVNGGSGALGTLNWNRFNVGRESTVDFQFTDQNQTALNKVEAAGGMSQIYGNITNSGAGASTGKVLLLNPNGVLFGTGANVNLNSFTVSTLDGNYDESSKTLQLNRSASANGKGIYVLEGATIKGSNGVFFAAPSIDLYKGSIIQTNAVDSLTGKAFGKVKLVTADGVNFTYAEDNSNADISSHVSSANEMKIQANGAITAGDIEIKNYSTHENSMINLNGAALKAVRAVKDSDGNIYLEAENKIITGGNSNLTTEIAADAHEVTEGGDIKFIAGNKVSVDSTEINSKGSAEFKTKTSGDVVLENAKIGAEKDINVDAKGVASVQKGSMLNADNNITILADTQRAQADNSEITAKKEVTLQSKTDNVYTNAAQIKGNSIKIISDNKKIITANTQLTTQAPEDLEGTLASGNVVLNAGDKISFGHSSAIDSNGAISITSKNSDVVIDQADIEAKGDINIIAQKDLSVQNTSNIRSSENSLSLMAQTGKAQVLNSELESKNSMIVMAQNGDVNTDGATLISNGIFLNAGNNITLNSSEFNDNVDGNSNIFSFMAGNDLNITDSDINAEKDVLIIATNGNAILDSTKATSKGKINVKSGEAATVQNKSSLTASNDVSILAGSGDISVNNSTLTATAADSTIKVSSENGNLNSEGAKFNSIKSITFEAKGGKLTFNDTEARTGEKLAFVAKNDITNENFGNSRLTSGKNVDVTSTEGSITFENTIPFMHVRGGLNLDAHKNLSITAEQLHLYGYPYNLYAREGKITLKANNDLTLGNYINLAAKEGVDLTSTNGNVTIHTLNLTDDLKTNITAGKNIDIKNTKGASTAPGIVAKAGENLTLTSTEKVDVSSLTAGGDMTLNVAGINASVREDDENRQNHFYEYSGDSTDKAIIDAGGNFTSTPEFKANGDTKTEQKEGYQEKRQLGKIGEESEDNILLYTKDKSAPLAPQDPTLDDNPSSDEKFPVPPSSSESSVISLNANNELNRLVLTDLNTEYTNKYINFKSGK